MKYSLLCLDMDGTLLDSRKQVSKRNIEAVGKAYEKGIMVVVCTGRMFTSAQYYADLLGIKTPVISSNGAYIREKDRGKVIYKALLGKDNCRKIVDILSKYHIAPNFHTPNALFTDKMNPSLETYSKFNLEAPEDMRIKINIVSNWEEIFEIAQDEIVKCITIDDIETIKNAKEEMLKLEDLEIVSSFVNNFEVMKKGVSKGRAVKVIADYYGIPREEIICIGDNENDLSMLEYAGLGIAMGNGDEIVKNIAQYVTSSNDEDGVAAAIEKFIL